MDRASVLNEARNSEEMQSEGSSRISTQLFIYSFILAFKSCLLNTRYGPGSVLEPAAVVVLITNAVGRGNGTARPQRRWTSVNFSVGGEI